MNDDQKAGWGVIAAIVVVCALISSAIKGCDSTSDRTPDPPVHRYDPNSTSEENRRMTRDQMIKQGVDPAEAEAFTKELNRLEKEHRRKHNLPDY